MSNEISIGAIIFIAVKPIIKIYLILFVGWLLVKYNLLTMETSRGISNMVVNALLPCLSFNKIVTNLSGSQIKEIGVVVLTAMVIFSTGCALALLTKFVTPVPRNWVWGLIFGGIFANISDLPIAYTQSMGTGIVFDENEANKGVALSCIFLACQQFLLMNMGMFQLVCLDFKDDGKTSKKNDDVENQEKPDRDEPDLEKGEAGNTDSDFNVVPLVRDGDNNSDAVSETSYSSFLTRRRRRSSVNSGITFSRVRTGESTYSTRARKPKLQNIQSLIDEYSEADRIKESRLDMGRTLSKTQEIGLNIDYEDEDEDEEHCKKKQKHQRWNTFIQKYKLQWLEYMLINLIRPASVSLLGSIIVAMIPWLRALFVTTDLKSIHDAPDNLPPLNFMMDFTLYVGNASIPMGLILLGGTIARLEIKEIPPGFWKTALMMTIARLVIMPIIGVLYTDRLYSSGWIDTDISRFVLILSWSVPSATAQVYFTAFYTPLEGDHIQMDCLAIFLLMQYPVLIVTLAITVSFVLKVTLGY